MIETWDSGTMDRDNDSVVKRRRELSTKQILEVVVSVYGVCFTYVRETKYLTPRFS